MGEKGGDGLMVEEGDGLMVEEGDGLMRTCHALLHSCKQPHLDMGSCS